MTARSPRTVPVLGYSAVLAEVVGRIASARHRALFAANAELVGLYWEIGRIIVRQQEAARWGDAVVERLSEDLRSAYPDIKGLSLPNIWKMRQFYLSCREIGGWLRREKLSTPSRERKIEARPAVRLSTLSREINSSGLLGLIIGLSWSHHAEVCSSVESPGARYFYLQMAVRERWSVRELRRQIDADLFTRYVSVRHDPEKCLPDKAERGDLLPFPILPAAGSGLAMGELRSPRAPVDGRGGEAEDDYGTRPSRAKAVYRTAFVGRADDLSAG